MRTSILTPPLTPAAVTWDMVRQHLRLDELDPAVLDSEQAYCMDLAAAATRTAGAITRCALLTTEYELDLLPGEMTARPYSGFRLWTWGRPAVLELDWPPLQAVSSVLWGEDTLVEGTDYWVAANSAGTPSVPGTITFRAGLFGEGCYCSWSDAAAAWAAPPLQVLYTAGFGDTPQDVPADVRSWILVRTGAQYEYREESAEVRNIVTMPFADSLLNNTRWFEFS